MKPSRKRKIDDVEDGLEPLHQPPSKKQKRLSICSKCKMRPVIKPSDLCWCCHRFKYKNKNSCSISLKSSHSELRDYCNKSHQWNLDKRQMNELCAACNKYWNEREKYESEINLSSLKTMKCILLSYLMCPQIEYYSNISVYIVNYNKTVRIEDHDTMKCQLMMHQWNIYSLHKNNLNKSIGIFKKMMKTLKMEHFIEMVFQLQPWMKVHDLYGIILYQLGKNHDTSGPPTFKEFSTMLHRSECIACVSLRGNVSKCWICHIAIKTIILMYFVIDLYIDDGEYFEALNEFIKNHCVGSCHNFWTLMLSGAHIRLLGTHAIPNHIIWHIASAKNEEYLLKPPIISREMLENVKNTMFEKLRRGFDWIAINHNHPQAVWLATELGADRLISLYDV